MIRDKIVFGVRDNAAQERLLREQTCRWSVQWTYAEQLKQATCSMKPCPAHSNIFMPSEQERKTGKVSQNNRANTVAKYKQYCGHVHPPRKCPAYGKKCKKNAVG